MSDAQHAADSGADRRDHHDAAENQIDIEPGIFRRLAIAADHVNVAAEARKGEHQMAAEQHQGGNNHDPRNAADRRRSERRDEVGHLVGNLPAHQQRRYAGCDLHHRERHDEGRDADECEPERIDETEHGTERQRQQDRRPAGHRDVGDVHVGFLRGEVGDGYAGDVGDARDRQVDLGAEDHEGEADGDDAGHRNLGQDVADIVERREGRACGGEEAAEADQRQERRYVAHLGAQHRRHLARPLAIRRGDCHAFTARHKNLLMPLPAGGPY